MTGQTRNKTRQTGQTGTVRNTGKVEGKGRYNKGKGRYVCILVLICITFVIIIILVYLCCKLKGEEDSLLSSYNRYMLIKMKNHREADTLHSSSC